ncbi:PPC domain-containing protein [Paenibacillus thiaminolyticus]|nr:PPC domain-containing protein [Paenibacillus thiaminolyticus]MCY9600229.1 PPC domain-containing protein [Paenibacillus thiaminolyticus]MCY9629239.1 PPC domain-containing protein [Paenibacillus thiaminolyticus]MCY9641828.1 PPC domain-containing protein [Paenibacillus thiaminolyticus]MEC0102399.1 PPC domain-containing protein [Paenibacillus thiaminolyticus]
MKKALIVFGTTAALLASVLAPTAGFAAPKTEVSSMPAKSKVMESSYIQGPIYEITEYESEKGSLYPGKGRAWYYFIPKKTSKYKITLTDLTEDADLFLLDENERTIAVSERKGSKDEKIIWKLEAGKKYYIGVWSVKRSETDFTLDIDRL